MNQCSYPGCNTPAVEVRPGIHGDAPIGGADGLCLAHHQQKLAIPDNMYDRAFHWNMQGHQLAREKKTFTEHDAMVIMTMRGRMHEALLLLLKEPLTPDNLASIIGQLKAIDSALQSFDPADHP